jgi:D-serine dehydratase
MHRPAVLKGPVMAAVRKHGRPWVKEHSGSIVGHQDTLAVGRSSHLVEQLIAMLQGDLLVAGQEQYAQLLALDAELHNWFKAHPKTAA